MFRSTLLGSILALAITPMGIAVNGYLSQPVAPQYSTELSDSLSMLSTTLVGMQARQAGAEDKFASELDKLTQAVASTQRASDEQVSRLVAMQADARVTFDNLLSDYSKEIKAEVADTVHQLVKAEVEDALPAAGVGTLNVESGPASGDGRPEDFADAAARIVKLEREVAALKARSNVSASSTVSYPATVQSQPYYGTVSNGSSGGTNSSYTMTPTYSYAQPTYSQTTYAQPSYSAPSYQPVVSSRTVQSSYAPMATTSQPKTTVYRSGIFRKTAVSTGGSCRIVNGQVICN